MATEALNAFEAGSVLALAGAVASGGAPQGHHTIPIYMCGANAAQPRVRLDVATHAEIHAKLQIGAGLTRIGLDRLAKKYLKKPVAGSGGRQPTDPIVRVASKKQGREVIAKVLGAFYSLNSYRTVGLDRTKLGAVFDEASDQFTKRGITSLPNCKR